MRGIVIAHHPVRHDIKYFPKLLERMSDLVNIRTVVLDKGYDAEYIHELIRNAGATSVIPARGDDVPIWHTSGSYRRQMKRNFPEEIYGERNKTETIFSLIKRIRGEVSELRDERERAVAQSACLQLTQDVLYFLAFFMISTKPFLYMTMGCLSILTWAGSPCS